ncbi:MAG: FAD-dependent oxidoreductase, partial [bacterium]
DTHHWPGNIAVPGPELLRTIREHAAHYGAQVIPEVITKIDVSKTPFSLTTQNGKIIQARSIIIATGASNRRLGVPGEADYFGKGVSTCATCDAFFYQDKEVVIVGGGDSAMTEADHLLHYVKKITIIQNTDSLTGKDPIKFKVEKNPKVTFIFNAMIKEIKGDGEKVTGVVIENTKDKTTTEITTSGIFLAIGFKPNTDFLKGLIDLDTYGYIKVHNETQTNIEGIFCAGDVRDYKYRQAIVAAGDGCKAALDAQKYLSKSNK